MGNQVYLSCANLSPSIIKLHNSDFTYAWKNLVSSDPDVDSFSSVEAQFNGWENPSMSLTFHIPIDSLVSGFATWEDWNKYVKNLYDGTGDNCVYLNIVVGNSDTSFKDYSSSTSGNSSIPVQIKTYNLRFSPGDSKNASHWTINAQLVVTV